MWLHHIFTPVISHYLGLGDGWAAAALNNYDEYQFFKLNVQELSDVQDFFIVGHMGVPFHPLIEIINKEYNITRPGFGYGNYSPRPNPGNVYFKYKSAKIYANAHNLKIELRFYPRDKHEYISVGYVSSTAVAVSHGREVSAFGVSA